MLSKYLLTEHILLINQKIYRDDEKVLQSKWKSLVKIVIWLARYTLFIII